MAARSVDVCSTGTQTACRCCWPTPDEPEPADEDDSCPLRPPRRAVTRELDDYEEWAEMVAAGPEQPPDCDACLCPWYDKRTLQLRLAAMECVLGDVVTHGAPNPTAAEQRLKAVRAKMEAAMRTVVQSTLAQSDHEMGCIGEWVEALQPLFPGPNGEQAEPMGVETFHYGLLTHKSVIEIVQRHVCREQRRNRLLNDENVALRDEIDALRYEIADQRTDMFKLRREVEQARIVGQFSLNKECLWTKNATAMRYLRGENERLKGIVSDLLTTMAEIPVDTNTTAKTKLVCDNVMAVLREYNLTAMQLRIEQ